MKLSMQDAVDMRPDILAWDGVDTKDAKAVAKANGVAYMLAPHENERDWSIADLRYKYYIIDKNGVYQRINESKGF
jgi:hypothetical protein